MNDPEHTLTRIADAMPRASFQSILLRIAAATLAFELSAGPRFADASCSGQGMR
jgi:hypothetical protein